MSVGPLSLPARPHRSAPARRSLCLVSLSSLDLNPRTRQVGVYLSGALLAAGWAFFIDACLLSATAKPDPSAPFDPVPVHVGFADWIPGLCSTLGMIIVNLIDKNGLVADALLDSDGLAWKARLVLFVGFALLAGGLAGSITVLVLKYVVPDWGMKRVIYWGVANVLQNFAIMLSTFSLWISQSGEEEFEYRI